MIRKILGFLAVAALLVALPVATAQDGDEQTNETRPDDAAWVDDCPPDMMCAMSDPHAQDPCEECMQPPKDDENVTRGEDCESCRGGDDSGDNLSYGDEDCAHCSGVSDEPAGEPYDDGPTYDGNCGGEVCAYDAPPGSDDDYVKAPEGSEGGITSVDDDAVAFTVPALGLAVGLGALGLAAVVVAARR